MKKESPPAAGATEGRLNRTPRIRKALVSLWQEAARRPTLSFGIACISLCLFYLLILASPAMDRLLRDWTGCSILYLIGSGPSIGHGKMRLFRLALWGYPIIVACLYLCMLRAKGNIARLMLIFPVALMYLASSALLLYPTHYYSLIEQIQIVDLPSVEYEEIFSKKPMLEADIKSYDDFHAHCRERFLKHKDYLMEKWGVRDESMLQAIFYTNLVSHMWGYGPADNRELRGRMIVDVKNDFKPANKPNIQAYIKGQTGYCVDSAYVLKTLLDRAGMKNRIVHVPGHVFNEALCEDGWIALDASTNMLLHGSWKDIHERRGRGRDVVKITIFPHQNLVEKDNPSYRSRMGHFRISWLLQIIDRTAPPIAYSD